MQYTLRGIPSAIDKALRALARREGRSLNEVTLDALRRALDLEEEPVKHRDLSNVAGSWIRDSAVERGLEDQRRIDEDLWR